MSSWSFSTSCLTARTKSKGLPGLAVRFLSLVVRSFFCHSLPGASRSYIKVGLNGWIAVWNNVKVAVLQLNKRALSNNMAVQSATVQVRVPRQRGETCTQTPGTRYRCFCSAPDHSRLAERNYADCPGARAGKEVGQCSYLSRSGGFEGCGSIAGAEVGGVDAKVLLPGLA